MKYGQYVATVIGKMYLMVEDGCLVALESVKEGVPLGQSEGTAGW